MFQFTPLLGAQCVSPASQSLLEFDGGVKVLIDIGWDESFDVGKLQDLESHVPTTAVVLLTHATINHLGAYAHCCKHVPLFNKIPVYATTPVINLGRTLLTDLYNSSPLAASIIPVNKLSVAGRSDFPEAALNLLHEAPTAEEIAGYFASIHPLRYSQPHQPMPSPFSPPLGGLTITAYGAGHTLGGTIWHIQHGLESIVYAADWNQGKENLIPGATWLGSAGGAAEIIEPLRHPTALICSARGVDKSSPIPRRKRDETLIGLVRETIAQGGKVLIPTDSSARVLELAFLLDSTWRDNIDGPHADTYKNVNVYMAGTTSSSALRNLRSMLEWIDDSVRADAEAAERNVQDGAGPLMWKYVKPIQRAKQLDRVLGRDQPWVMLASDASMEWGFSRKALQALASDRRNLVILTDSAGLTVVPGVLRQLWSVWNEKVGHVSTQSGAKIVDCEGQAVTVRKTVREPPTEEEALILQHFVNRQQQMHSALQDNFTENDPSATEVADDQMSESSDSEDDEDDAEHQGRALNLSAQLAQNTKRKVGLSDAELGINVLLRGRGVHDYDVRNRRGREKLFPFQTQRLRSDDFGEVIKPEDYLRAEERDNVGSADTRNAMNDKNEADTIGQKRKWHQDVTSIASKKTKTDQQPDNIDAAIARATGEVDNADDDGDDSTDDNDYEKGGSAGARKVVFTDESLACQFKIAHVDFSGLHERRDLQMLIPLIRPRHLILVLGSPSETQSLSHECRDLLRGENNTDIFLPLVGETIDASVDTNAWTLKLSQQLVKKLAWQNVKGLGIVALTGKLDLEDGHQEALKQDGNQTKRAKTEATEDLTSYAGPPMAMPLLDVFQATQTQQQQQHQISAPVHVGDLRLASLRQLVTASGHTAEFRGEGTLLVDGTVIVRKGRSGYIEVEAGAGGLSIPHYRTRENEGSFFAVRKLIYDGLAIVAGA